jgi:nucleoside 2-deoxyribosyltransferase
MKRVYLSGPIAGMTHDEAVDWRVRFDGQLATDLVGVNPLRGKDFLRAHGVLGSEAYAENPLSTNAAIYGRDFLDTKTADAMVVYALDMERELASVGTLIEIGWANAFGVPIVLVARKSQTWLTKHPLVLGCCQYIVPTIEEAAHICNLLLSDRMAAWVG